MRELLDPSVEELFAKAPKLQIFLDTVIGHFPPVEHSALVEPSHYALVRVEIVRSHDGQRWSWGQIDRKIDRLAI